MRQPIPQQNKISRSRLLGLQPHFPTNSIPVNASEMVTATLPYARSTGFTPTSSFYRHVTHAVAHVDLTDWRLNVHGLVSKSLNFSFDDIRNIQSVEMPCTLAAITSTPNNLLVSHALWRGISFKGLLDAVGFHSEAQYAQFTSVNGYVTYLPLKLLDNALLAYEMNGELLSAEQGYPMRLIVPGVYDYKMPKWLHSVELVAVPSSGHYESRGWSADGIVQTTSAIFTPRMRESVNGKVSFSGMAFAGTRAITQIELSIDDGDWMPVPFVRATNGSWTRWHIDWQAPAPGDYLVKVRAIDSDGFTQPDASNLSIFPKGSSAIHAVVFRVSM